MQISIAIARTMYLYNFCFTSSCNILVVNSMAKYAICIINHTLPSTIRAVISTLTCTSMASNSTSNSECYLAVRVHVRVLTLP